jgi:hypothetical protein
MMNRSIEPCSEPVTSTFQVVDITGEHVSLNIVFVANTWSQTVREEHKLRVFENRVLRIFGPKRDGVTGGWRKLHNEGLHNLYSSPSIIRII